MKINSPEKYRVASALEVCDVCRVRKLCKEDILASLDELSGYIHSAADCRLPERHVEHMMKSEGNESPFYNSEDQCTKIAGACYQAAQCKDCILYQRPDKVHQDSYKHVDDCGNDGYEPGTAEKGQCIGKLNPMIAVMKCSYAESYDDAAENTHLQSRDSAHVGNGALQYVCGNYAVFNFSGKLQNAVDRDVHNKKAMRDARAATSFFFCHTNCNAYRKDEGKVIEDGASDFVHDHKQAMEQSTFSKNSLQTVGRYCGGIGERTADAEKKAGYRENCNGEHKASPYAL